MKYKLNLRIGDESLINTDLLRAVMFVTEFEEGKYVEPSEDCVMPFLRYMGYVEFCKGLTRDIDESTTTNTEWYNELSEESKKYIAVKEGE